MVRASSFFVAAGLAAFTIAAGSEPENCVMTNNSNGSTTVTGLGCSINFPGGCNDCEVYLDSGHNITVLGCEKLGTMWTYYCRGEQPHCDNSTDTCEMLAPYGTPIEDEEIKDGYKPSSFTTWNGCRLGCQVNSALCQSFTFSVPGVDSQGDSKAQACKNGTENGCKCTWYRAADKSSLQKLIWVFNMGVQAFSFDENGIINHGTVSQAYRVLTDPVPVDNPFAADEVDCMQAYATMWQSMKAGTSKTTLSPSESLIGGFTTGHDMPKDDEWFGIDVPLPRKFISVSIVYNANPDLQGITSDLQGISPSCNGNYLMAYEDGTIGLAKTSEAEAFTWSIPPDSPGVFARVKNGETQGALRVDDNKNGNYTLGFSTMCGIGDEYCGMVTNNYKDLVESKGMPAKIQKETLWDFWQPGNSPFNTSHGCIRTKNDSCTAPVNAIIENQNDQNDCDNGWKFRFVPKKRSLQATRKQGKCVFYKISHSSERVLQSTSIDTDKDCTICARRFGNFSCITNQTDRCTLAPSFTFCESEKKLNGTFCHKPSTGTCCQKEYQACTRELACKQALGCMKLCKEVNIACEEHCFHNVETAQETALHTCSKEKKCYNFIPHETVIHI